MKKVLAAMLTTSLLAPTGVQAQEPGLRVRSATRTVEVVTQGEPFVSPSRTRTPLRDAIARNSVRPAQAPRPWRASRPTRLSRGVTGALLGAFAGMLAGGSLGWALTKDCGCDDPGMGAVYGWPIGGI